MKEGRAMVTVYKIVQWIPPDGTDETNGQLCSINSGPKAAHTTFYNPDKETFPRIPGSLLFALPDDRELAIRTWISWNICMSQLWLAEAPTLCPAPKYISKFDDQEYILRY